MFGEREGADTFASDGEDGVADGGKNRRERWLAEVVDFLEVDYEVAG